jgi:hypothetical protein
MFLLWFDEEVLAGRCHKLVGLFGLRSEAEARIQQICGSLGEAFEFFDTFGWPRPNKIIPDNFEIEERRVDGTLDDWKDGQPDAWDYEAVLRECGVTVEWCRQVSSDGETFTEAPPDLCGWGLDWKHGFIRIGQTTEQIARKAAALFVSLWLRGVSASFCDKLMDGFITYLERQDVS